ncbi:MAG: 16S rRNA (guanine(966)-N(2))-methyltransferase RsmD [Actinomycetota bacterium]|nr:16S rRNA (guanine(966)-N(2))-methyltransferase RsmD [Actinomycetota bacterium]
MRGIRVIAGSERGRRLVVPPGDSVRPTKDIVRESMFNALDSRRRLVDAAVLDLFAGTGALGIEALSRGAASAVFVERDRNAISAIETNLDTLGLADRGRVVRSDVGAVLGGALPRETPFDVVLIDPPYDCGDEEIATVLRALRGPGWLAEDAMVSVERRTKPRSDVPDDVVIEWERAFGDTLVRFLKLM